MVHSASSSSAHKQAVRGPVFLPATSTPGPAPGSSQPHIHLSAGASSTVPLSLPTTRKQSHSRAHTDQRLHRAALHAASLPSRTVAPGSANARGSATSSINPEINEKVKDALDEEHEMDGVLQERSRASQIAGRSMSRDRIRSMQVIDTQARRVDKSNSDIEWDEKRGLSLRSSDAPLISGPSNVRQSHTGSLHVQGPVCSSGLTSTSIVPHESHRTPNPVPQTPPPYASLPSFSSSHSLPAYPYSSSYSSYSSSVRRMLLVERVRPWLPFLLYAATSLGFVLAIAFWKDEVFGGLDDLAQWLKSEGETGYAVMFAMIFLTCIPPLPLYSTLQVLSGYTFGAWNGAILSYFSALAGALFVFAISRSLPSLQSSITTCLAHSRSLKRVVRAVSRRPTLLFLVRLAPYPYNVMNALLAGCPRLSFKTYTVCTALSLTKVIVHTSVGAGIKNFATYHSSSQSSKGDSGSKDTENTSDGDGWDEFIGQVSTVAGIVLCIITAIYLSYVARRAVDEELEDDGDDEDGDDLSGNRGRRIRRDGYDVRADDEERAAFLAPNPLGVDFAMDAAERGRGQAMVERESVRLSTPSPGPPQSSRGQPYGPPEWSQ